MKTSRHSLRVSSDFQGLALRAWGILFAFSGCIWYGLEGGPDPVQAAPLAQGCLVLGGLLTFILGLALTEAGGCHRSAYGSPAHEFLRARGEGVDDGFEQVLRPVRRRCTSRRAKAAPVKRRRRAPAQVLTFAPRPLPSTGRSLLARPSAAPCRA